MLLYFFPDAPMVTGHTWPEVRAKFGLGHLDGTDVTAREVHRGPEGKRGCVVHPRVAGQPATGLISYTPDAQTWEQPEGRGYWVGWPTDQPPQPEELARRRGVPGRLTELGDGNEWVVPVLQLFDQTDNGPVLDDIGALPHVPANRDCTAFRVKPRYVAIRARARVIWETVWKSASKDFSAIPLPERLQFVSDVLALTYHVDLDLLLALGVLGNDDLQMALETIFDTARLVEIVSGIQEKKTEASPGLSGTDGAAA